MASLYVIGGISRCGKTTILEAFLRRRPVATVRGDAVRVGVRNMLVGSPYMGVEKVHLKGEVEFTDLTAERGPDMTYVTGTRSFDYETNQDDLTWQVMKGIIAYYDARSLDLAIEGVYLTPERIHELELRNLELRPLFVGFINLERIEGILGHAKQVQSGWVYQNLLDNHMDETFMRAWAQDQVVRSAEIKTLCAEYGYQYLDIHEAASFKEFVRTAIGYLAGKRWWDLF